MNIDPVILSPTLVIDFRDVFDKFWHFIVVGAFGFFLDVSITYLLYRGLKIQKYIANSVGFVSGLTFNYYFNRIWTFKSDDPQILLQYSKFATIGVIGLFIVNGVLYLLHNRLKLPFFWSKVLAMFVFMFWNFSANYFYTFS